MLGWEELTSITNKAYMMIGDKKASFIYCENYGQAGAITIIGKKYGLPEAVCFNESFRYWIPLKFDPDITSFIYVNDKLGKTLKCFLIKSHWSVKYQILMQGNMGLPYICVKIQIAVLMYSGPIV